MYLNFGTPLRDIHDTNHHNFRARRDSGIALKIDIEGQIGSLAKDNADPVRVADLKSGVADEVIADNITATLKQLNHPAELPPVNMMNWMIVVREIHPKYVPEANVEAAVFAGE